MTATLTPTSAPPRPAPARPKTHGHVVLGAFLVIAGLIALAAQAGVFIGPWPALPGVLLVLLGAGLVVEGILGRSHSGLIVLGVIITVVAAASLTGPRAWQVSIGGTGDRTFVPVSAADLQPSYELGAGNLRLDLTGLQVPEGTTAIEASVGLGEVQVQVPAEVAVRVDATAGTGDVRLFEQSRSGFGVSDTYVSPGYETAGRRLDLRLSTGMGQVEVTR